MKKSFLLAALVGVALTSCTKNEPVAPAPQGITFEVGTYKASTRANGAYTGGSFGAFAYYAEDGGASSPVVFMNDQEVANNGTQWAPNGKSYYWPVQGSLDFICYAPYTAACKPTISPAGTWNQMAWTGYTVDGTDLLYGDKAENYTQNNTKEQNKTELGVDVGFEGVPTLFHHALAKLNFKVMAEKLDDTDIKWDIAVKSIEISGVYSEGNLALTTTNGDPAVADVLDWTLPSPAVWASPATAITKEWEVTTVNDCGLADAADKPVGQLLTTSAANFTGAQDYIVLPQTMVADQQQLTVTYDITTTNGSAVYKKEYTNVVDFEAYTLKNWEMGKNITYTIVISPEGKPILFAPAVEDWVSVVGGTIDMSPAI